MFKESLIHFEIQVGEKTEKHSLSRYNIYGFIEKDEQGICIFTSYGIYKLITPVGEVTKQIDEYDELQKSIDRDRSMDNAKLMAKEMKKLMDESERDRLFGDDK